MNGLWSQLFRSVYRKEPITGFMLIVGAVDVAIGGVSESGIPLVVVGLGTVGAAMALRWLQFQHRQRPTPKDTEPPRSVPILPAQSTRAVLPPLSSKQPPGR
jgi:hypothetical protein